jgi:hypothetical protein
MKRLAFGLAACVAIGLCGWGGGLRGDEPAKDQPKPDAAKELAALQKEWADAQQTFRKAYGEAKTDEERQQVVKDKQPKPADFADRFLKLAETYPDSSEAVPALAWLLNFGAGTPAGQKAQSQIPKLKEKLVAMTDLDQLQKILSRLPASTFMDLAPQIAEKAKKNLDHPQALLLLMWVCGATAYAGESPLGKLYHSTVDFLMERFPERPELTPLATIWLARDPNPDWAEKHLRNLMAKNSLENVRTSARFGLASILENKDEASQPEAEKLFQSFVDESNESPGNKQLAEQAKNELAEMKVRGIGKPVPDIVGDDLDSKAFKLSDYKGKVVLIDFWAFW